MRIQKTKRKRLFPLAVILMAAICCARNDRNPVQRPLGRGYHAMAYDEESRRIILFGGQTGDINNHPDAFLSAETWAYDPAGNRWRQMSPGQSPPPMSAQAMAYDSESDRVILHGGGGIFEKERYGDAVLNQTWAYDYNNNKWMKMSDGPPRLGHRMVYDVESDRIVMFGGACFREGRFQDVQDTWAYDFNTDTWTEMKPSMSPAARHYHGMAYDKKLDKVILWGGFLGKTITDASIWTYDFNSNSWSERKPANGRDLRWYHAMAYDDASDQIIVFGGMDDGNTDTWSYNYDSNSWTKIDTPDTPGKLSRMPMVYIPELRRMVLFGGQLDSRQFIYSDETWVYDPQSNIWTNKTVRQGEYFGQRKPGPIPEVFAPRLITRERPVHSSVAISPDWKEIYWSSFFEDAIQGVIVSSKWEDEGWTMPELLSFSDKFDARNPFLSPDGKKLYFFGRKAPAEDPAAAYKIWVAQRKGGAWTEPKALDSAVNSGRWDAGPSIARNGNLYFTSFRDDSQGMFDIYRANFIDGRYAPAERLGNEINSDSWDLYPYIAPDESSIIFSSTRPGGFGGQDLYISFRKQDGTWTSAKNMGPVLNSDRDEMFPLVTAARKYLFFGRSYGAAERSHWVDIYWVDAKILEELRPKGLQSREDEQ